MSKKQLVALVVAALVFVGVCSASIYMNQWADTQVSSVVQMEEYLFEMAPLPTTPYIGVIAVEGNIVDSGTTDVFGNVVGYDHQRTLDLIDEMTYSYSNEGILLYVNSPGGSVYDSDELYLKLKQYKDETGRPVWTYMADEACSGGYYIAMASDKIYANRNTVTGSIGVIMSFTNYKELFDKIGLQEVYITSGRNKSMGAGDLDLTEEQYGIFQSIVDEAYDQFVGIVADGRGISPSTVRPLADGRVYTAKQAQDNGLIDEIAPYEDMAYAFSDALGGVEIYVPEYPNVFQLQSLFSTVRDFLTRSDAKAISDFFETNGSGVPMYYAIPGKF